VWIHLFQEFHSCFNFISFRTNLNENQEGKKGWGCKPPWRVVMSMFSLGTGVVWLLGHDLHHILLNFAKEFVSVLFMMFIFVLPLVSRVVFACGVLGSTFTFEICPPPTLRFCNTWCQMLSVGGCSYLSPLNLEVSLFQLHQLFAH
jgi:hypothetical protein